MNQLITMGDLSPEHFEALYDQVRIINSVEIQDLHNAADKIIEIGLSKIGLYYWIKT
jgi:hypothetical protein